MAQVAKVPTKKAVTKTKVAEEKDLATLRLELRNLLLDIRTGKEKNTARAKLVRKQIARLLTKERINSNNNGR